MKSKLLNGLLMTALTFFGVHCLGQGNIQIVQADTGGIVSTTSQSSSPDTAISGSNTGATLSIPAGGLIEDTQIDIAQSDKLPVQEGIVPLQATYEFSPEGLQFNKPATLDICYDVQEITSQGLTEDTVQIYYLDPVTGDYANIGGTVNTTTHCVSAQVEHFSSYLAGAQTLTSNPTIGNPTFLPSTPLAGIPLRVRSVITNFPPANPQSVTLAAVNLWYRVTGSPTFKKLAMAPDLINTVSQTYYAIIPATDVTLSGIDYYIETVDSLGNTKMNPLTAPGTFTSRAIADSIDPVTPLRLVPTLDPLNIAAGFSRDFTVQSQSLAGSWYNVVPDSYSTTGSIGNVSTPLITTLRFTAQTVGSGSLDVTVGAFPFSKNINVAPGNIVSISLLNQSNGIKITSAINLYSGENFIFDVVGSDAYGNSQINVVPAFSTTGGIGSVTIVPGLGAMLTAASVSTQTSGTVLADLAGITDTVMVNITPLSRPTGLMAIAASTQNTLSWSPISGAAAYNIYWSTTPGVTTGTGTKITVAGTPYTHTGLSNGTTYYYIVTSVNGSAESPPSLQASATFRNYENKFASMLNDKRQFHTSTALADGTVLLAGGHNGVSVVATAETYDPNKNTFTSTTGTMVLARYRHTATLLGNGKVLITGGISSTGTIATEELYDPVMRTFSPTSGTMSSPRYNHTATLLNDGNVLITGGYNGSSVVATAEIYNPVTDSFSSAGNMSTTRYYHTATLLADGRVLITGGINNGGTSLLSTELYDPSTNTFTATVGMNSRRYAHVATLLSDGKVLITGGIDNAGTTLNLADLYDPATNTFTPTTTTMNARRREHTSTLLVGGYVLISGGLNNAGTPISTAELYNPTSNTFSQTTGNMSSAHSRHEATLLSNGKVLVTGGLLAAGVVTSSVDLYDPATDTFSPPMNMSSARYYHMATLLSDGNVLITGGHNGVNSVNLADLYNPVTSTFTSTVNMNSQRYCHSSTLLLNGKVLITGGNDGVSAVATAELFDPATGAFTTTTGNMSSPRYCHASTLLPNGKVLITGGHNGVSAISTAELYDPATDSFSSAGYMGSPRHWHTATLLSNGTVLIAGGHNSSQGISSAEIYDPVSNTFTATTGNMRNNRYIHTATLLPNGKVLITGGHNGINAGHATADLYDPVTNTFSAAGNMTRVRYLQTATLLPDGNVLVVGGNNGAGAISTADLYNPATNSFTLVTGSMNIARQRHAAIALPNGKVLITGGNSGTTLATAELYQ